VVTNTVLVSVTQRTRDIGIRRAVGAPRAQILAEVLAESVLTAAIGGVAGLAIALAALAGASAALDLSLAPSWTTVGGALVAAAATGLVAGYFPARKAAHIDIITALRSE
jgi:ABC-type antimicrobial peptide transport system permease subunit